MLYLPLCISWFKESKHTHRSFAKILYFPLCISWFSKHTHRKFCQHYQCCTFPYVYLDSKRVSILIEAVLPTLPMMYFPLCISWFSKHTQVLPTLPMLYLPLCISWFKESKHTHRSSFANITNVVPSLLITWGKWSLFLETTQCWHLFVTLPKEI